MSALAARRAAREAAAASAAASIAPSGPAATHGESSKTAADDARRSSKPPTFTPSSPSVPALSDSESESDPDVVVESSSKRRRIDKSPSRPQRYFVQPASTKRKKESREERAWSPGAPAELDAAEDSDNASVASGSSDGGEAEMDAAAEEVDEGTMRWTALSAPATPAPGSSVAGRAFGRPDGAAAAPSTSIFEPKEGVNFVRHTEDALTAAGVTGSGPGVVVSLGSTETLMIAGIYSLTPLQQVIRLLNTTLSPDGSTYPIFAPTSHPVPVLQTAQSSAPSSSRFLRALRLPNTFRLADGKETRTVFLIREHECGLEGLKNGAVPGFTNAFMDGAGTWGLRGVHPVIGSFSTPVYPYDEPASWTSALASLAPAEDTEDAIAPVVLVKGPKRTGKSSIARAALNTLLGEYEQVAWLECDLGQGEFGCGGMVGLWILDKPVLGPPFTHQSVPVRALYLGTYTPLTCPDEYIAAIRHLLDHYKYELQYSTAAVPSSPTSSKGNDVVPLVINTQGWVKGLGEDLLRGIESQSSPTHVFAFEHPAIPDDEASPYAHAQVQSYSPRYNPSLLPPEQGGPAEPARLFVLDPAPMSPLQARYTGADMRILSMITYLHGRRGAAHAAWDLSVPLGAVAPIEVDLGHAGPIRQVFMIGEGADGVHAEDLDLALNGSIVALGRNDAMSPAEEMYRTGRPLPAHDDMTVFGLGLVRAIRRHDTSDGPEYTLQVITPLAGDVLERVNCVVKNGAIELPTCGLLDWRSEGEKGEKVFGAVLHGGEVPFLEKSGAGGGVGWERKKVRRNLQRRNV